MEMHRLLVSFIQYFFTFILSVMLIFSGILGEMLLVIFLWLDVSYGFLKISIFWTKIIRNIIF